jgi:hypothetical protein
LFSVPAIKHLNVSLLQQKKRLLLKNPDTGTASCSSSATLVLVQLLDSEEQN